MLNQYVLISGRRKFRICEIEFYYKEVEGHHKDIYTHAHELQKSSGKWYQHGSGLDITCGNDKAYGGILIRALQELNEEGEEINYIYGPLKSLHILMENFGSVDKHEITFGLEKVHGGFITSESVLNATRVGLNPVHDKEMQQKMYRYFIFPQKPHDRKGEIIASLRGRIEDDKLKELFGWKTLPDPK
ncbi:hypothetical protein SAMN00777080_0610 [Aquiflexum balticum DSM 16537]|uniref:Uncharacterized protein n=1 Tax=Aquiflexum balticum DSM 16537 TaxID=758820 RepID=A0A1W2GZK1_9BACT|nr:hypothetical protein SAMN00777080_0610 [Aquiflexum balticum DSM 16537]